MRSKQTAGVRKGDLGVDHHLPGGHLSGGDDRNRPAGVHYRQVGLLRTAQQVACQVKVAVGGGQLVGLVDRLGRDLEIRDHRTALLRQAGLVEPADEASVEERGDGQRLGNGNDAGAADPGDAHAKLLGRHDHFRIRQLIGLEVGWLARFGFVPGTTVRNEGQLPLTQV